MQDLLLKILMAAANANLFNIGVYLFLLFTGIYFIYGSLRTIKIQQKEEIRQHIISHILDAVCIVLIAIGYITLEIRRVMEEQWADNDILRSLLELFVAYRLLATIYHYQREQDKTSPFYIDKPTDGQP